jgi:hypothetical protein
LQMPDDFREWVQMQTTVLLLRLLWH